MKAHSVNFSGCSNEDFHWAWFYMSIIICAEKCSIALTRDFQKYNCCLRKPSLREISKAFSVIN